MNSYEEKALVTAAQAGDREALGKLWDQVTPKLFGYLVNTLRDRELAEDVLQSTWLSAIKALPAYQFRGKKIEAWLFAIARNECGQHWRKTKHQIAFNEFEHDRTGQDHADLENKLMVEHMLSLLSEEDRELVRLRYIADLPLSDIAMILNINFVSVRVRLHRALRRVRKAINEQHEDK